jgi:hypothetical protein
MQIEKVQSAWQVPTSTSFLFNLLQPLLWNLVLTLALARRSPTGQAAEQTSWSLVLTLALAHWAGGRTNLLESTIHTSCPHSMALRFSSLNP